MIRIHKLVALLSLLGRLMTHLRLEFKSWLLCLLCLDVCLLVRGLMRVLKAELVANIEAKMDPTSNIDANRPLKLLCHAGKTNTKCD